MADGIVLMSTAGFFDVEADGGVVRCRLRGRLKKEQRKTDLCVIGDRVRISTISETEGLVEEVLPRQKVFSRRHPGKGGKHREDVLVANLDQLFIVFAFREPRLSIRMLDRFIAIAEYNDIRPIIVANKSDLAEAEQEAVFTGYRELGYELFVVSAKTGVGVEALRGVIANRVSAFAGPSGAGKSSLLNALDPTLKLRVAATSEKLNKGRHTTRRAELFRVGGGYVADTPGIRELGTWGITPEALDQCFVEIAPHAADCGFRNCLHLSEPQCAVKAAVLQGSIREERYESYCRLVADDER